MIISIRNWFSGRTRPTEASPAAPAYLGTGLAKSPRGADAATGVVSYPPVDTGIQVVPVERVVASQRELIERIRRTAGFDEASFEAHCMITIRNLARFVHLLPATATHHHRGTGGLFRFALELALFSMQSANGSVFPIPGSVDRRFLMQPKWALATFIAGMCGQLYRTINAMAVLTHDNDQWEPLLISLYDWALSINADVYFVRWREGSGITGAQASSAFVVNQIVPAATLQYLSVDNSQIMPAMMAAIAGWDGRGEENPIGRLVAPLVTRLIDKDARNAASNYGHLVIGVHLERHLIDTMRQLVRSGRWTPNARTGVLWVGQDGVFLDWPTAANDISSGLIRSGFVGIPSDPETLAEILVLAGVLQRPTEGGSGYWTITTPVTAEAKDFAIRLAQRDLIFPQGYDLKQYDGITLLLNESPQLVIPSIVPPPQRPVRESPQKHKDVVPNNTKPQPQPTRPSSHTGTDTSQPVAPDEKSILPTPQHQLNIDGDGSVNGGNGEAVESTPGGASRQRLLNSMAKEAAAILSIILDRYDRKENLPHIISHHKGVAIDDVELAEHGMSAPALIAELAEKQWLWVDQTKPTKKIHQFPNPNGDPNHIRAIVVKGDIARAMGFVWMESL